MLEFPGTSYCKSDFSVVNNLEKLFSVEMKFSMLSFSLGMTFFGKFQQKRLTRFQE